MFAILHAEDVYMPIVLLPPKDHCPQAMRTAFQNCDKLVAIVSTAVLQFEISVLSCPIYELLHNAA